MTRYESYESLEQNLSRNNRIWEGPKQIRSPLVRDTRPNDEILIWPFQKYSPDHIDALPYTNLSWSSSLYALLPSH